MPKFHVVAGACSMAEGGMELLCSTSPGVVESYTSAHPIGAFEWPMDTMTRLPGYRDMTYESMLEYLQHRSYWWIARVWKSYSGNFDMHVRFAYSDRMYFYVLEFDPKYVTVGVDYDGWPTPRDFYMARKSIRIDWQPLGEYNAAYATPNGYVAPAEDDDAGELGAAAGGSATAGGTGAGMASSSLGYSGTGNSSLSSGSGGNSAGGPL